MPGAKKDAQVMGQEHFRLLTECRLKMLYGAGIASRLEMLRPRIS